MKEVKLKKTELIQAVRENREKHDAIFVAAVEGYWIEAEEKLKERLVDVANKKQFSSHLNLEYPVSHVDDYDKVLQMLEYSVDDEIVLDQGEFSAYVRNQWAWRHGFLSSNIRYGSKATTLSVSGAYNTALNSF
jgi:hypothetical protein